MMDNYDMDQRIDQAINAGIVRAGRTRGMRRTTLVAVAALLALSVGTLAATGHLGSVDWRGRPVKEEYIPESTAIPGTEIPASVDEWVDEWGQSKPDLEYWIALSEDGGGRLFVPAINTDSLDEVKADIERSGLRQPTWIPQGYILSDVNAPLYFDRQLLEQTELIEKSESPYGHRLLKYQPGKDIRNNIHEYSATYRNAHGQRLQIWGRLRYHEDGQSFGLQEGVDYSIEKVDGMDEAFLYHYLDDDHWELIIKQNKLKANIRYIWPDLEQEDGASPAEQMYDQAVYTIWIEDGSKQDVIRIAENLK